MALTYGFTITWIGLQLYVPYSILPFNSPPIGFSGWITWELHDSFQSHCALSHPALKLIPLCWWKGHTNRLTGQLPNSFNNTECPACLSSSDNMKHTGISSSCFITSIEEVCACVLAHFVDVWWQYCAHDTRHHLVNLKLNIGCNY